MADEDTLLHMESIMGFDVEENEYESGLWHPEMVRWQQSVKRDYPEWKTKSYLVPPVHINEQALHKKENITGRSVTVTEAPDKSHTQDDLAVQHALHCFQYLANWEVMFILSNLDFPNYLKWMRIYNPKSKFVLPRTSDSKLKNKGLHKGDFDILVLHRRYGVLGCEVKSKGYEGFENKVWNEGQKKAVVKKINEAVIQLKKYREVLSHILSDLKPACRLQMSLILPYLDRKRLMDLFNDNDEARKVKQELCVCLGLTKTSDPTPYCLLSDDMPDKHQPMELTDAVKTSLDTWWSRVMSDHGDDPYMTETRYLNIISRFCGPDTEISGPRTVDEAVAHMAEEFLKFRLTNDQLKIVKEEWPYLWLVGPPGVGKTVVLIGKALQWLEEGMEVHVVSLYDQGRAAAELICSDLQQFEPEKVHLIHLHHTPSDGEGPVLKTLETAAKKHKVAVVMDEANEIMSMQSETDQSCPLPSQYESFICTIVELDIKRLWAASCHPVGRSIMDNRRLTQSLRAPPAIARETAKSSALKMKYSEFKLGDIPPVSDGVGRVKVIEHLSGGEHQGGIPADCRHCGMELAKFLLEDLRVGDDRPRITSQGNKMKRSPLRFEHIFILSINPCSTDLNRPAGEGQRESYRHFLLGLQDGGVPVRVVQRQDHKGVQSVAIPKLEVKGVAIASDIYTVRGLERPLVVWVQTEKEGSRQQASEVDLARLYGMSRSAGHLVCVCTPGVARDAGWLS